MQKLDYLYAKLVNGLVSTLLQELLVLGLFFVFYGYITQIIKNPKLIRSWEFIKRIILLGDVCLFVFYIALTYFMPYQYVSFEQVIEQIRSFEGEHLFRAKLTLLVMAPIDLLTIVILAGMFASLGQETFENTSMTESKGRLDSRMLNLFLLTSLWHFVVVIWWVVFDALTNQPFSANDIVYHLIFSLLHLSGYFGWKKLLGKSSNWLAVSYYSMLILTVYTSRIWMYIDKI